VRNQLFYSDLAAYGLLYFDGELRHGLVMNSRLHILHLEDDPDYSGLVRDLLTKEGVAADILLVTERAEFDAALAEEKFDLILADYSLPTWTGVQALAVARVKAPRTPFLLVSGTIGEQAAIESLRGGATDYVLKQWPDRLVPAVRRAVGEAEERARRRLAEMELERREKYFRALTENSLDILAVVNRAGVFQYNSPSLQRVLGHDPQAVVGTKFFEIIHPEDLPAVMRSFEYALEHPQITVTVECRARHRDGSWVYLEAVGQNRLSDPDIAAVVINSRDITERKRVEHQNEALSNLGRSLSSVTSQEEAARIIQAVAEELFGLDVFTLDLYDGEADQMRPVLNVDTLAGRRTEIPIPQSINEPSGLARRIIAQGRELILREDLTTMLPGAVPFGDTARPSASLMFAPIRNRTKVIGILSIQSYTRDAYEPRDLDTMQVLADHCGGALERIRAVQALRESDQRFRDLFEGSPDASFVEDLEGRVLDVNPAACRLHGMTREELIGKNVAELVPPASRPLVARNFQKLVSGELTRAEGESCAADGTITPVEVRAGHIQYGGRPAVLLHVRDISDRKHAESALRSSELLFHSVWENSVDGMRLTDENGLTVAVNEAFCNLVGMTRGELEGKPFTIVYAESEPTAQILAQYQGRFRDRVFQREVERRLTLRNGQMLILEDTNSFVELRGHPPMLLSLFRDVTQQKRLEEQLRQSQKMEAIGQLAGGVAHDFNNILTVIHGHASLLVAANALAEGPAKSARQIIQAADRAAGLTRQLLTFSRRQMLQPRRLDMNEVVTGMTTLLDRILGEDIALQVECWPHPTFVQADAGMMEQVFLNLAVNARDAMPRGGQLNIQITLVDMEGQHLAQHSEARPGRFVCLTATDTGCGIAPEILPRIFEPFFTTKETGKGTGLGLATVYGILKQHQGWVEVDSAPGRGTTFRVYVPASDAKPDRGEAPAEPVAARGGTETILVVEDEQPVRELVCSLLQARGYRVLEAETGPRALKVWQANREEIDLLLTDMVMPERMNGWELAEILWAERPGLKVIFTSGYSHDVVGQEFVTRCGANYLQKPYHPEKLARIVRDHLDAPEPVARP
jgi:PAS domain S-box-containing protein